MNKTIVWNTVVLPLVRHGLQALAGFLIASGQLDVTNAETLTGALLGISTVGWWYFTRQKPAK